MADLNPIAKRIHQFSPGPVELTLDDGTVAVFRISGAEFFQREFQAEGICEADDADYRFVSSADTESILVGRKGPDESEWTMTGTVTEVNRAES
ncbi:transcriptional regulator [Natronorubrum sp. JWXQ-INN-674]|uniref:Transcriptional regulator n=1 Tax=Natronorubrum halalkaliphilum TaxID=2691917 RepID=A0A6B0VK23_9EURY|nr:transcriptional regulator [Natronorubrum halalkaliphilum]MXV61894.1 transcriptional regulator [Natronorubrum halalkaliphilum]